MAYKNSLEYLKLNQQYRSGTFERIKGNGNE